MVIGGFHNEEAVSKMKYTQLGTVTVSRLGLGGSAFGDVFGENSLEEYGDVVELALKNGINFIDISPFYGDTKAEENLGKILKERKIPRKAFFISSKVGRYGSMKNHQIDFSSTKITKSVDESLERLGLDCLDFVLAHDIEYAPSTDVIVNEALPTLEKLKKMGKVKHIGFSCYPLYLFKEIIDKSEVKIDFVITYCHYCLFDTSLADYLSYFKSKGVDVISAAPLGMGLLTNPGPPTWHPACDEIKTACKEAAEYCQNKNIDISKLALYFAYLNEDIVTTVVSSQRSEYTRKNIEAVTKELSTTEQETLQYIQNNFFRNLRTTTW